MYPWLLWGELLAWLQSCCNSGFTRPYIRTAGCCNWRTREVCQVLFYLTGDIQIGKTRWLESLIDELCRLGVPTYGVVAPGRWIERPEGFEKLGIDNVMLPQGTRVAFAEPAERGWTFSVDAIKRVNRHMDELFSQRNEAPSGLLAIDELGWMELSGNRGLTEAVRLIDAGPASAFPHALVVVRETLLPKALARFENAGWGVSCVVAPDNPSLEKVKAALTA